MRSISEGDLSVFISLLCSKIVDMKKELSHLEPIEVNELTDEQMEDQYQLQEMIEQYQVILGGLRDEYEAGLTTGLNLPSYEELTEVLTCVK